MSIIGAHVSNELSEIHEDIQNVINNGGKIIQMFTNKFSKKAIDEYKKIRLFLEKYNVKCVVHSSYTINLAQNWDYHSWWLKQLVLEIQMAKIVGAFAIVVHLGKQLQLPKEVATNNMYTALLNVLSQTQDTNIKILLETSSGQGSEMFYNLEEFGEFFKKFGNTKFKDRIGICLDTCHIFAAGYDIRGEKDVFKFLEYVDKVIGLNNIKVIHLNDSQNDVNSHVDRHANIGEGYIGRKSLMTICRFFNKLGIPIILETPFEEIMTDLYNLTR